MALGLAGKAIVGVGLTGIATGAGVGSYFYLKQPEPIEIEIEKLILQEHKGKSILGNTNKQKGLALWTKYDTDNTDKGAGKDEWKINGWPIADPKPKTEAPEGLITACQAKKKEKVKNKEDKTYLNFFKWCLVDKN